MALKKNRVVLVTGGSRGVGKGTAIALGATGATVYVSGRSSSDGQTTALPGNIHTTAKNYRQRVMELLSFVITQMTNKLQL